MVENVLILRRDEENGFSDPAFKKGDDGRFSPFLSYSSSSSLSVQQNYYCQSSSPSCSQ
jgi:hypothetical protein